MRLSARGCPGRALCGPRGARRLDLARTASAEAARWLRPSRPGLHLLGSLQRAAAGARPGDLFAAARCDPGATAVAATLARAHRSCGRASSRDRRRTALAALARGSSSAWRRRPARGQSRTDRRAVPSEGHGSRARPPLARSGPAAARVGSSHLWSRVSSSKWTGSITSRRSAYLVDSTAMRRPPPRPSWRRARAPGRLSRRGGRPDEMGRHDESVVALERAWRDRAQRRRGAVASYTRASEGSPAAFRPERPSRARACAGMASTGGARRARLGALPAGPGASARRREPDERAALRYARAGSSRRVTPTGRHRRAVAAHAHPTGRDRDLRERPQKRSLIDMRADMSRTVTRDHDAEGEDQVEGAGPCLYLLLECDRPLSSSSRHALSDLDQVVVGRGPARRAARSERDGSRLLALGVPDSRMSMVHARLVRDMGRWILEDAGSKNGVILNGERHERAVLEDGDLFELGHTLSVPRGFERPGHHRSARCGLGLRAGPAASFTPSWGDRSASWSIWRARRCRCWCKARRDVRSSGPRGHPVRRRGAFVASTARAARTLVESDFSSTSWALPRRRRPARLIRSATGTLFLADRHLSPPSQAALCACCISARYAAWPSRLVSGHLQVVAPPTTTCAPWSRAASSAAIVPRIALHVRLPLLSRGARNRPAAGSLLPRVAPTTPTPSACGSRRLARCSLRVPLNLPICGCLASPPRLPDAAR